MTSASVVPRPLIYLAHPKKATCMYFSPQGKAGATFPEASVNAINT